MRIVVTGGAGFIGSNLCRVLVAAGDEVVAFDDLSTGYTENLDGVDAELVVGDIRDPGELDAAFAGADALVHLAARGSVPKSVADPVASHDRNATGTLMVLEAARRAGNPYTLVASSSSVYGATPDLPKHEALPTRPVSPYAASKVAAEWYAQAYQHSYGLPVLAFRFFNVYGPRQPAGHAYAAVMPAFISAALAGEPLTVHDDGEQSRDFTFVDTVCEALALAVHDGRTHDIPVNLAFGSQISLLEIVDVLEGVLDTELQLRHTDRRPGDVRHTRADPTRFRSLFPEIEPTDFEAGIRATVEWFRRRP